MRLIALAALAAATVSAAEKKLIDELRRGEGLQPPRASRSLFERVRNAFGG